MSDPSLFRAQVLKPREAQDAGVVAWMSAGQRFFVPFFLLALLVLTAGVLQLPRAERLTVPGIVTTPHKPLRVTAPDGGVVSALHVIPGATVASGQPLVTLRRALVGADGRTVQALQIDQHRGALRALERETAVARAQISARFEAMRAQQERAEEAGVAAREQLDLLQRRTDLHAQHMQRATWLIEEGVLTSRDEDLLRDEYLRLQSQRLQWQERLGEQVHQAGNLQRQIQGLGLERRAQTLALQQRRRDLQDRIARLEQAQREVIIAPGPGEVVDLNVQRGAQLLPGQRVLTLASAASGYELELALTPEASALVRPGLPLRVRFAGYPYQDYGMGQGVVTAVNRVASLDSGAIVYRGIAQLVQLPASIGELPIDMPVTADVLRSSKPLYAWLAAPLQVAWEGL
ncbi:MAG: HlyD family efflux transporter periplasmic adaptor subunit [Pseudomonadota bacterium]